MDKRYQVFVSSTYGDLRDERQEVMQALLELDCIPSGMELFPAADEDQWSLIKRVIDDCDYYIVIIAGRYGSIGPDGKSYTQMEYEYATSSKKPVIAFLHGEPGKIQADKTDPDNREALTVFRGLAQQKMCKFWTTPQELGSVVSRSIVKLIKDKPGVGWVRADRVLDEGTAQEILRLRNRIAELETAVASSQQKALESAKHLAQGDEKISVKFSYTRPHGDVECTHEFTWNELVTVLSPILLGAEAGDVELKKKTNEVIRNRMTDGKFEGWAPYIRDEDFQRIKIQLRALGIIRASELVDRKGASQNTWVLTPYGDQLMTQIAAIKSKKVLPPGGLRGTEGSAQPS